MSQELILQYLYACYIRGDREYHSAKDIHRGTRCDCDIRNTMRGISRLFDSRLIEMDGVTFVQEIVKLQRPVRKYRLSMSHIAQVEARIREFNQQLKPTVSDETIPPYIPRI